MSDDEPMIKEIPNPNIEEVACSDQNQRTKQVAREAHRMANRLERDGVAVLFQIQVYGFDCNNSAHVEKDGKRVQSHVDYIAGGGRLEVPGARQTVIKALEHSLAELKKQIQ